MVKIGGGGEGGRAVVEEVWPENQPEKKRGVCWCVEWVGE